jgi:hypothetical protein
MGMEKSDGASKNALALDAKLAKVKAENAAWSSLAANPTLSLEARHAARQAARSSAAAVKLAQKALAWQNDPEKADKEHQRYLGLQKVPPPEAVQPVAKRLAERGDLS